ncbi:MAG TPA: hypothetical protein VNJ08_09890 [Bacteriovoracaceae bacterium]|nr:hypothetical protein [Bacteriovoracaceae bacterium]
MLKNRYQEILVGLNLMSLVRGLISRRKNRSTLLIHDFRFQAESYPGSFLSELEILALIRLGKQYEVPELTDLRQFLAPASVQFITQDGRLKLGMSPFENLREVLRKFPELIASSDLDLVFADGEKEFDRHFIAELVRYESLCFESSQRPKGLNFEILGPNWLKSIYVKFGQLINQEYAESHSLKYAGLLHLLGLSSEEKLKTRLGPEEIPFYFFRMLSPIFRLQDFFLTTQLKRRLSLLGGDYKESRVQYWQLHENKFENLLLASFEGVISGDRVLFFSHLPVEVPFNISSPYPFYRKTQVVPQKRTTSPFPPTSITYLADLSVLGSERPYRAYAFEQDLAWYHFPYLELPGSKAEFYDRQLIESYEKDQMRVPFESEVAKPQGTLSVSLDLRKLREDRKAPAPILSRLPLKITEKEQVIDGFEYWGPFKYKSMGLLALCYGVEGN